MVDEPIPAVHKLSITHW